MSDSEAKNQRVLIIDDNRAIHDDFRKILCPPAARSALDAADAALFGEPVPVQQHAAFEIDSAYQGQDGVRLIQEALAAGRPYAMAFVDVRMPPGLDGVQTTRRIWELDPTVQIVLCTAYSDYSWNEMFAELGHSDGLLILKKPFDAVEALQLAHALTEKWRLRRAAEHKLEELEQRVSRRTDELHRQQTELRALFDLMPAMILFKDTNNRILRVNQRVAENTGMTVAEIEGMTSDEMYPDDADAFYADDLEVIQSKQPKLGIVTTVKDGDGEEHWIQTDKVPVCDAEGNVTGIIVMGQDITERKQAEAALRESEERFSGAFEHAPIGVALVSPEGRFIKVNRALCRLVGFSEAELLAQTFQDITHPADLASDMEYVRRLLANEMRSYQLEKRYVHAAGHLVSVMLHVSLVRDAAGVPRYFISQIQDITARKRTEQSLRLLSSAVEQSKESIMITEAELDLPGPKIIFVNPAFTLMTGYNASEVVGRTPRLLHGPRTDRAVLDRLRQNLMEGEAFTGETVNYRKDGTEFDMEWQIAPLRNADYVITHFVAIQRDISGRKRMEEQFRQSQKMETVGKLAGGVAHEFNSILTAIIGQSELLLSDLPPASPQAQNVAEISKAADRAAALTRQLLAYGRKQILKTEALDLNRVLTGMAGMFHHLMGADVATQIIPGPGLHAVQADAGQMEQVIMNMVINARDAMPGGGKLILETANVTLDATYISRFPASELTAGDYVMLGITDNGVGMTPGVKARVFEPFFTTKGVGQGAGLGLSSCYGIIKQSGGHISVYSEHGRGSTFKIYLPKVTISAPAPIAPVLPTLAASASATTSDSPPARRTAPPPNLPQGTSTSSSPTSPCPT